MSIRLEMLQVLRLAPRILGESAARVVAFLEGEISSEPETAGFKNRNGEVDLYYTVFGSEALFALQKLPSEEQKATSPTPQMSVARRNYLTSFADGAELDLVHLCCLTRAWKISGFPPPSGIAEHLETYRADGGGYNSTRHADHGTIYGSFLVASAYQDLERLIPAPERILAACSALRAKDGGFANAPNLPQGTTPATAAAIILFRSLGVNPKNLAESCDSAGEWLLARHVGSGFTAAPTAPIPDLLSTATALHALAGLDVDLAPITESCLDFVDSLWTNRGGFFGYWSDEAADAEYTWYALLALGHLAVYTRSN